MQAFPPRPDLPLEDDSFLRGLVHTLLDDPHAVDDVVQETYLEALARPPRDRSAIRGWMATVARHLAGKELRGRRRRIDRERSAARPESEMPEVGTYEQEELLHALRDALEELREPYRSTVHLRYGEGLGLTQIADRLGVPPETIHTRLRRALQHLRLRMKRTESRERRERFAALLFWPSRWLRPEAFRYHALAVSGLLIAACLPIVLFLVGPGDRRPNLAPVPGSSVNDVELEKLVVGRPAPSARNPRKVAPVRSVTTELRVRLLWEDGEPAAGVRASVVGATPGSPLTPWERAPGLVANREGRLTPLVLTEARTALVTLDRVEGAREIALVEGSPTEVDLRLPPAAALTGRVVDTDGRPIEGAVIYRQTEDEHGEYEAVLGITGPNGSYAVRDLAADGFVGARHDNHGPSQLIWVRGTGAVPDVRLDMELTTERVRLQVVVSGGGGAPLEGARLMWRMPDTLPSWRGADYAIQVHSGYATTASDGKAKLGGLRAGNVLLSVEAPGHAPREFELDLSSGDDRFLAVELPREVVIAGRVLGSRSCPVPGARVTALAESSPPTFVTSESDGSYRICVLPGRIELVTVAPDGRSARQWLDARSSGGLEADVEVGFVHSLRGRVVRAGTGAPLPGLLVSALPSLELGIDELTPEGACSTGNQQLHTRTNDRGEFVLGAPVAGSYRLSIAAADATTVVLWSATVTADSEAIEVALRASSLPTAVLGLALVDAAGLPVRDARFARLFQGALPVPIPARELEPGRYELGPLVPGVVVLGAERGDGHRAVLGQFTLAKRDARGLGELLWPDEGSVRLRLAPRGDGQDRQIAKLCDGYWWVPRDLEYQGDVYHREGVPAGRYTLQVTGYGEAYAAMGLEVEVRAGEELVVELCPERGERTVFCFDELREARFGDAVHYVIRDAEGQLEWMGRAPRNSRGELGTWRFLEPGVHVLEVSAADGRSIEHSFEVPAADGEVRLRFE